jgi:hypothetical protein
MFIVTTTKDKTITWPVTVEVAADGGKIAKHEFTGVFKLLSDADRKALADEAPKLDAGDIADDAVVTVAEIDWKEQSVDNILKAMTDWKGVCDETKTPIEFNRDSLLAIARSVHGLSFLRAINTALGEISTGSRAKN